MPDKNFPPVLVSIDKSAKQNAARVWSWALRAAGAYGLEPSSASDASDRRKSRDCACNLVGIAFGLSLLLSMGSVSFATESGGIVNDPSAGAKKDSGPTIPTAEELARLKQAVEDSPQEAKTHYAYAHALRLLAKNERAVTEYLDATALEPTLYVAYHELALSKARPDQLDQAIERLELLKEHRPKDLLLCVALSELYEQRDNLYFAAKVLSDLLHTNSVPEKYLARVKTRVHYLLTKNKDAQAASQIQHDDLEGESAPLPLPESSLKRNLSAGQMKDARVMQSFGHAPLLP